MYKYRIYGMTFETDIELCECEKADDCERVDVIVRQSDLQDMVDEIGDREKAIAEQLQPDEPLPSKYTKKDKETYSSYIVGMIYVRIIGDSIIEYRAVRDTNDIVFHQWLLCYAMTLALIRRHEIILHCAGLLIPNSDDTILVCGDSGAGKSTVSNALLNKGLLFVSDDSVRVATVDGEAKVYGSCMQRRLCEDVVESGRYDKSVLEHFEENNKKKWVVNMGSEYYGGVPHTLKSIFFLSLKQTGDPAIKEVCGAQKITQIMRCLYKIGAYKDEGLTTELFMKFTAIAKDVRVFIIERPEDKMTVEAITKMIIDKAEETA
ncbi:hypothetical protein SAMN02910339_02533 [Lachnospiraceae bacterium YSD2013]|nr:hypothetical protein SAMN02910339_02533 [Lachnospiraceae bacterium YSD2013]